MPTDDRLLVLDVHGVIFTNPVLRFLGEVAEREGLDRNEVLSTWTSRLRRPFWLGELAPAALWATLFPRADADALGAELEDRYREGPLFGALDAIDGPVWLLSNHRSDWLLPRLQRFGLGDRFERIYVSDELGYIKPEVGAFRFVQDLVGDRPIRYVDDKPENVAAAATVFAESILVTTMLEDLHARTR
jgi:putative hydrolase of the HAD superfamily